MPMGLKKDPGCQQDQNAHKMQIAGTTVDGSEIREKPVDMVNIPLFTGFHTSQVVSRISEPSTV